MSGLGHAAGRQCGVLAALAALSLGACTADGQRPTATLAPSLSAPANHAATSGKRGSVPVPGVAPVVMPAPQAPARVQVPVGSLIGRLGQEVRSELGKPDFNLREAPAELWQYRQGPCLLEVILYSEQGVLRVGHAEIRSRHPAVDPSACGGIVDQLRGQPATPAQGA